MSEFLFFSCKSLKERFGLSERFEGSERVTVAEETFEVFEF